MIALAVGALIAAVLIALEPLADFDLLSLELPGISVAYSSNITEVQHGATETGSASAQVLSAAQSLSTESSRLRREVDQFLVTVRAT